MDWLLSRLSGELFSLSGTPITSLTLVLILSAVAIGVALSPLTQRLLRGAEGGASPIANEPAGGGRFGTFTGVFTPSILTILGVVMYLRVGWCVGNAGLAGTLLIVGISHLITIATGLSVSSIATNRTVGAGGAYFIISRSLGAPAGAAIGIPLFFGQALSVTFYIVGFTESLQQLVPGIPTMAVSSAVCLLLTGISLKSADLALKVQYVVMAAIALSLISFFFGKPISTEATVGAVEWWGPKVGGQPFAAVFAVFFPAVTGIMAGVGMSGDLKDPRHSLPRGTMLSILVGMVVYIAFPIWLAINASGQAMRESTTVVWEVSRLPSLIYAGVWGATLSSAVGSILTAPRTLQALAVDGLAPRLFSRGHGPANEPRIGVIATFILAQTGILLGNLDAIAPVLTMFFLATYGLTNLACGLEKWAASPSFRPDFTVPAAVSLIGGLACFYVMSIINMLAMFAAMTLCATIYIFTQRRVLGTTYGDARHGIWAALVRSALHRLRNAEFHPLNWRPNLIILGGDHEKRPWLLTLGSALVQERGIVTYFQLLTGQVEDYAGRRRDLAKALDERVHQQFPNVFCRVDVVNNKYQGAVTISQSYGVGSFEANTVMLGWLSKEEHRAGYVQMLREMVGLDRSLLIVRYDQERKFGKHQQIHIWWGGLQANGGLMLLMAYLLTAHHNWRHAKVFVNTVVNDELEQRKVIKAIERTLANARVIGTPNVILREGRTIAEIMRSVSADADLAIVGLRLPDPGSAELTQFFDRMNTMLDCMPTTILVHSARNFLSEPVLFDNPDAREDERKDETVELKPKAAKPEVRDEPETKDAEAKPEPDADAGYADSDSEAGDDKKE